METQVEREQFRALEIRPDGAECWITSDSIKWFGDSLWLKHTDDSWIQCYPHTRSVSYPNMFDKNGKNIFASLSEDGVGGDIITDGVAECYLIHYGYRSSFRYIDFDYGEHFYDYHNIEVIGIHKVSQ